MNISKNILRKHERQKEIRIKNKMFIDYSNKIIQNTDKFWIPKFDKKYSAIETNSCFNIKEQTMPIKAINKISINFPDDNEYHKEITKCKQIDIKLNKQQKKIINRWLDSDIIMYNQTMKLIRKYVHLSDLLFIKNGKHKIAKLYDNIRQFESDKYEASKDKKIIMKEFAIFKKKIDQKKNQKNRKILGEQIHALQGQLKNLNFVISINIKRIHRECLKISKIKAKMSKKYKYIDYYLNYKNIRTYYLKDIRDKIIKNSQIKDCPTNMQIKTHMLDCSIKRACANYKTCKSNFFNGTQKKFKIKYQKCNKSNKIIEIEGEYIRNNQICPNILGDIKYSYNNENYKLQNNGTVFIHYNNELNKYTLLVSEKIKTINKENNPNKQEFIGLDPGIRTFMTGFTNNKLVKFGTNISSKIRKLLEQTDNIKNKSIVPLKIKNKIEKRCNRKIYNMVDELHWKIIDNLVKHYGVILIGNLSSKNISNKETSNLSRINKRIASRLRFYKFRQRLEYKCQCNGSNYKLIDEKYTSKMCSNCSHYDEYLGAKEIYKCKNCKITIDRDANSSRGITIKGL